MSIDINWDTITSGSDGPALAERIRAFLHDKFQEVELPRFINSVQVNAFDFGKVSPEIEIKDVCDPLPDFYEDDGSDEEAAGDDKVPPTLKDNAPNHLNQDRLQRLQDQILRGQSARTPTPANAIAMQNGRGHDEDGPRLERRGVLQPGLGEQHAGLFPRSGTPGMAGGASNLGYFNLPIGGRSGSQTPLAAVAGGTSFPISSWQRNTEQHLGFQPGQSGLGHTAPLAPPFETPTEGVRKPSSCSRRPSTANTIPSPDFGSPMSVASPGKRATNRSAPGNPLDNTVADDDMSLPTRHSQSVQPTDIQIVARVQYAGDVQMILTAEILLDYPMPSFVGIPMQLAITGITFDGVAIVAYIKNRMHFCFLSPDDADALVGDQLNTALADETSKQQGRPAAGGLLQEIRVESEIGKKENGKQVLKNVGKVEKFVLEQVRTIFEDEFVFPSFWTFLV